MFLGDSKKSPTDRVKMGFKYLFLAGAERKVVGKIGIGTW